MPSYGQQITQEDRWKIVRHVRQLQSVAAAPVAATGGKP
jgi:hypothetical protein